MEAFLVKVWTPGAADVGSGLRGTVVHLPTGRLLAFTEPSSLIDFLTATSEPATGRGEVPGSPSKPPGGAGSIERVGDGRDEGVVDH